MLEKNPQYMETLRKVQEATGWLEKGLRFHVVMLRDVLWIMHLLSVYQKLG